MMLQGLGVYKPWFLRLEVIGKLRFNIIWSRHVCEGWRVEKRPEALQGLFGPIGVRSGWCAFFWAGFHDRQ